MPGSSSCREKLEPHLLKTSRDRRNSAFVRLVHGYEDCSLGRQHVVSRELRLSKRAAEGIRDPHDLASRAHLGSENRIELAELVEWKYCFLHGDVRGKNFLGESDLVEHFTEHHSPRDCGELNADRL